MIIDHYLTTKHVLDYTKGITLHIQGLEMSFHRAFLEVDEYTPINIPPEVDIHSISIEKIGGHKPCLVHIIYLDNRYQEQQQAYMGTWYDGNLLLHPIYDEPPTNHNFSHEQALPMDPIGIVIHLPSKHLTTSGWLSLCQGGYPLRSSPYRLEGDSRLTYLHT